MFTPGYDEENKTKPKIAREIESADDGLTADQAALGLFNGHYTWLLPLLQTLIYLIRGGEGAGSYHCRPNHKSFPSINPWLRTENQLDSWRSIWSHCFCTFIVVCILVSIAQVFDIPGRYAYMASVSWQEGCCTPKRTPRVSTSKWILRVEYIPIRGIIRRSAVVEPYEFRVRCYSLPASEHEYMRRKTVILWNHQYTFILRSRSHLQRCFNSPRFN